MFQFPSNGKAYPKAKPEVKRSKRDTMFQFPSNGKAYPKVQGRRKVSSEDKFQFPSNGKTYPKALNLFEKINPEPRVSIPFKRESLSKECTEPPTSLSEQLGFQFPSNGKAYPKQQVCKESGQWPVCFNSLQTGKPIQSLACPTQPGENKNVSIPFKRESLSKVKEMLKATGVKNIYSFNSLQTGKPIQSYS